jgi:hypothetical protein
MWAGRKLSSGPLFFYRLAVCELITALRPNTINFCSDRFQVTQA